MPAAAARVAERFLFRLVDEPEGTQLSEDADHWCNVYGELIVGLRYIAAAETRKGRRWRLLQVRQLEERLSYWQTESRRLGHVT